MDRGRVTIQKLRLIQTRPYRFFQKPRESELRDMHGQSTITGKIAQEQEEHDRTVYAQTGMVTGDPPDGPIVQAELAALTQDTGPNKHWWGGKKTKTKIKSNRKSKKSNRKSKKSNRKSKKSNRKSKKSNRKSKKSNRKSKKSNRKSKRNRRR